MDPSTLDSGLARHLANLCGALLIPDVMGRIGIFGLCALGRPYILDGLGASSSRLRNILPFSDFLYTFLACTVNASASVFAYLSGFLSHVLLLLSRYNILIT